MRKFRIWNHLSSSLWFVPILCVLAGVCLSFATIALDRSVSLVPRSLSGDPDAALAILTTVAASMVTLTGLVLTITMVVVQLATGQFTPRVLRTILRDRPSQFAIGVFVATFAHAMLVMREVRHPTDSAPDGFVPGVAIIVAFVLIIVSIMVLVSYVNHIGQSLRAASLIDSVGDDTRDLILELYPECAPRPSPLPELPAGPARMVVAPKPGVLFKVAEDELVEKAAKYDVTIRMIPRIGDFVPTGGSLFAVYGDGQVEPDDLLRFIAVGKERTLHQDVAYGIRMLVDVAVRALSPASGDPTTAVQAIDRIHDCLRLLVSRDFPTGEHLDREGRLRLVVPVLSWEGMVHVALDELRLFAVQSMQATRRTTAMLLDLIALAPEERRAPLRYQLERLDALAHDAFEAPDSDWAMEPDQQGVGSGPVGILQTVDGEPRSVVRRG
jgi:uncharacterized membrane protein